MGYFCRRAKGGARLGDVAMPNQPLDVLRELIPAYVKRRGPRPMLTDEVFALDTQAFESAVDLEGIVPSATDGPEQPGQSVRGLHLSEIHSLHAKIGADRYPQ